MFQFSCRFAFLINLFFKPHTENNANFDAVSRKCANFEEVQFCKTYTYTHTIWHT